jgi:hypothetical protein
MNTSAVELINRKMPTLPSPYCFKTLHSHDLSLSLSKYSLSIGGIALRFAPLRFTWMKGQSGSKDLQLCKLVLHGCEGQLPGHGLLSDQLLGHGLLLGELHQLCA